jgi:hypothetical protein
MRSDSHCVQACVTLDLCGYIFASERLRTARLQVNYAKGKKIGLSNEVVSYRQGGAADAISELKKAVATCPSGPVGSAVRGVGPITYHLTRLHHSGLLPGYVALEVHASGTANGHRFNATTVAVYQIHGNFLSGVYSGFVDSRGALVQATALTLHAAEASARNLT